MKKIIPDSEEPPSRQGAAKGAIIAPAVPVSIPENTSHENQGSFWRKFRSKIGRVLLPKTNSLKEDVAELIEEHDPEREKLGNEERELVDNILGLGGKTVHDIMIPRADIIAVSSGMAIPDLRKLVLEYEHTRMPVYRETLDQIIGFLHIKDLIPFFGQETKKEFQMAKVVREILFVPPSMRIMDLLIRMKDRRVHIAIVLDEYGGTEGLVTMEDIVEEIVGDIEDEHDDVSESDVIMIDDRTFQVKARMNMQALEKKLNVSFGHDHEEEDFDTLGGFIFYLLGRIPEKGEIITQQSGIVFEILEADPRRIRKVMVRKV